MPGSHAVITAEPHVRALADAVREALAAARERVARAGGRPAEPGEETPGGAPAECVCA